MMKPVSCQQAKEVIWDAAGRSSEAPEAEWLKDHLAGCPDCRRLQTDNRQILDLLQRDEPPDPGSEFWGRLTTGIMAEVRREEARPKPWYQRPWLNPLVWPAYAWSPALVLVVMAAVWIYYTPVAQQTLVSSNGGPAAEVYLEDTLDPLADPFFNLTPNQTRLLRQKVVAGLAQDIKTRSESPEEALLDWDMNNRLDGLNNDELEGLAKKLQTIGPTGTREVSRNVS